MYIVMELQTNSDGTVGTLVYKFESRLEAESKYHTVLAAAAISALPMHAAVLLTNKGQMITSEYYEHEEEQ